MRILSTSILLGLALLSSGCSYTDTVVEEFPLPPVIIRDINGRQYNIAYAVYILGFDEKEFSEGAGPDARPPIVDPEMLVEGQPGYPPEDATTRVIGAAAGGESRAYAIEDISRNEVVDDRVGGAHIAVAYWPLVDLAAVYSREIDGEVLLMTTSGFTYLQQHVLYDENTGSLWFHMGGSDDLTCIAGLLEGRVLNGVRDSMAGPWHIWKYRHPRTQYLKPPPR